MSTFPRILHCDGCTDRLTYQRNIALLALGKAFMDLLTIEYLPNVDGGLLLWSWINPFALVQPWLNGALHSFFCLSTLALFMGLVWNSVHRARDTGKSHWLGFLSAIPFVHVVATITLATLRSKKRSVWDLV